MTEKPTHCPACNKDVDYEMSDEEYVCLLCGRTHRVAIGVSERQKKRALSAKIKRILIVFAIVLFILLFMAFPDNMSNALGRGIGKSVILIVGAGVVYAIISLLKRIAK